MASEKGPLEGKTILDLSSVGPASRATRLLADYGARVVKVAPLSRDQGLQIAPPFFAYSAHRGMERTEVDLKSTGGRDAFLALAAVADVVVESMRPGVVDRLGIGFEAVSKVNRRIVYCSTTGYGQSGPRSSWAGHDICYLGVGGFLGAGEPLDEGRPPLPGATIADAAAGGMQAALGVAATLAGRLDAAAYLDVSIADGVLWLMSLAVDEHLATGEHVGWGHDVLSGRYACYATYSTADGKSLALGAIEEKFFENVLKSANLEKWSGYQYDDGAQDDLRMALAKAFAGRTRDDWLAAVEGVDTCLAPVLSPEEAATARSDAVLEACGPDGKNFRQLAPLLAGMRRYDSPVTVPDMSVTTTVDLLGEAGVSTDRIEEWIGEGAIR